MSTAFPELFAALAAPFEAGEVKRREVKDRHTGRAEVLHYVRPQTVKNRLDTVMGPENWWTAYLPVEGGVECRLSLRMPDGREVTKGGAGSGKDVKAAYSDALKRAAEEFGVGRYLRRLGVPRFDAEAAPAPAPAPAVPPSQARPDRTRPADMPRAPEAAELPPAVDARRASLRLLDWAGAEGRSAGVNLTNYLARWGNGRGFPPRIKDWSDDQVKAGYNEARRKLAAVGDAREPEPEPAGAGAGAGRSNGRH